MVYYYTSTNVKLLRNIIYDYAASKNLCPSEYMKMYIEKYPTENSDDAKLAWIAETFIDIEKHLQFVKEVASHLSEELFEDDIDYFMIAFHAVTFQIPPKDFRHLYKCLFNLSKPLLSTFTKVLCNNEILPFISQIGLGFYDVNYITEKIISPLFAWQPYISEMEHDFSEYEKKNRNRRLKPPTVPIQPKVLDHKPKEKIVEALASTPALNTPPNSLHNKNKRMLTKNVIDQKLSQIHEKNKQRATHLLNEVKNKELHYAPGKTDSYPKKVSGIREELNVAMKQMPKYTKLKKTLPIDVLVKDNAATIKRMNKRIKATEEEEIQWLQSLVNNCKTASNIEELEEKNRQETERERLLDIERKHLQGQISFEEAVLAKKKLFQDNKKKYEQFQQEKIAWNEAVEEWKQEESERNKKSIEKLCLLELNLVRAKNEVVEKKKLLALNVKKESEALMEKALKEKQEELEQRINMIKEIKILALIAKKAQVPKIIDLTETSGLGLLCEMSMAELQERLSGMKMALDEELAKKKQQIKDENLTAKQKLEETKVQIKEYMREQAINRLKKKKVDLTNVAKTPSTEIETLKKILIEKRKLRAKLSC